MSLSDSQPFNRMLVRIEKEIISFGVEAVRPADYTSAKADSLMGIVHSMLMRHRSKFTYGSYKLSFAHPRTGEALRFKAERPEWV